ncbi:MAG: RNA polymerase sigma factor [Verrucomicrobiales bacterium]
MNQDTEHDRLRDQALLRRFVNDGDEPAFRRLVEKYTGLVYGVAMRRTSNRQAAEEVSQNVFVVLAKKAGSLTDQRSLGAWLHRTATFESLKSLRKDATQQRHLTMIRDRQLTSPADKDEAIWREVRPQLDEVLDRLPNTDRDILVAHYFEGLPFAAIAANANTTPAAAQKRSVRALKKLASMLAKRGAVIPLGLLGSGLGTELSHAAPAHLAANIASGVFAGGATTAAAASHHLSTLITAMSTSKLAIAASFILAASIPIGIRLSTADAAANKPVELMNEARLAPRGAAADSRFSAMAFREALERLYDDDGNQGNLAARKRRLQRLILSLNLEELQGAVGVLEEFEDPDPLHEIIGVTFSRWAELDPESAIADASSRPPSRWGYYPLHGAWDTWAFTDWESAHGWLISAESAYDQSFLLWGYLDSMAGIDGAQTVERARQFGGDFPERSGQLLRRALSSWTKKQPEQAIAWMRSELGDPVERDELLGRALESLGEPQPEAALAEVQHLDNPERLREVRYNIFWTWALQHPLEAAEYFERTGAGDLWDASTLRSAGESFARNLPARAMEISRTISRPDNRDSYYVGVLSGATLSGSAPPDILLEAAEAISEEGAKTNSSLTSFLRSWASHDRAAAEAWVESLPDGGKKEFARHMFPRPQSGDQP